MIKQYLLIFTLFIFFLFAIALPTRATYTKKDCHDQSIPTVIISENPCDDECVTPTENISPTEILPTATIEVTPTNTPTNTSDGLSDGRSDGKSDGRSDGRSDGLCSQPPCITPGAVIPQQPPATGRGN